MSEILNDDDTLEVPDELSTLKARADMLGLSYHPNIGVEKLREKITAHLAEEPTEVAEDKAIKDTVAAAPEEATEETPMQRKIRKRKEATELVRIRVQCMNPAKKEWEGEIFTVGNALVGTISKYVPFNDAEDGWHVPRMLYKHLLERQCQVFTTVTDSRGNKTRKGKLIREFAIELLPPLTPSELKDLAQRQAMAKSVD